MANIFYVENQVKVNNLNCQSLKELLSNKKSICAEIVESGNGWLIKIDECSIDVLAQIDFVLSGKLNNQPYCLVFEKSSLPFPEKQRFPSYNEKCTGKVEAKILMSNIPCSTTKEEFLEYFESTLPYGGKVQHIRIESGSATITFFDEIVANRVASKTPLYFHGKWIDIFKDTSVCEVQENEVATKTVSVHGVPEDMDLEELQLFFENHRRSGGGKIEKGAERNTGTNLVEITFATEEVAKRVVEKSPLTYNNCTLEVSLMQPLKTDESPVENTQEFPAKSDQRTIVVYDVPKTLHSDEVMLYFENNRSSKGGKITDIDFDRKNGIKITFDSPTVARNVFEKKNHVIDNNTVKVSMYKPPLMEEKKVLICDINEKISSDALKNFVESKCNVDVKHVEKVKHGIWLMIFPDKVDFENLKQICKSESKKYISETYPKVRQIPITNKVIVSNCSSKINEEFLRNFFHSPLSPDDLVSVKILPGKRYVITFKNSNLASKISQLKRKDFDIKLYHDYISSNEEYKDINLKSAFWLNFLKDQKEVCEDQLKDCGHPVWSESHEKTLRIMHDDNIEEKNIEENVKALLETICEERLCIPSAIFEEVKEITLNAKNDITIYFDNENFTAHIFSFNKTIAKDHYKKLLEIVEKKSNTKIEKKFKPHQISLIFSDFIPQLDSKYKVEIKNIDTNLVFSGFSADIAAVQEHMYEFLIEIQSTPVQLPQNSHHILKQKPVKEYIHKKLKMKKCSCALEITPEDQVLVHCSKKNNLKIATGILKDCIVEFTFELTDPIKIIMQEDKWKTFMQNVLVKNNKCYKEIQQNTLSIVTTNEEAPKIGAQLEKFFETNVKYSSTLSLQYGIYEFLKKFEMNSIRQFCNNSNLVSITFDDDQAVHITGTIKSKVEAEDFLQLRIKKIIVKSETFSHFGFMKFLKAEDTMLTNMSGPYRCIVLKNENESNRVLTNPVSTHQVEYGRTKIIPRFGDITELDVDVIVNSANKKLQHVGGMGKEIVQKGGQVIQEECNKFMSDKGLEEVLEGSTTVTTAGKLKCKIIIHAVGPAWKGGNNYETEFLSEAIVNSLVIAEKKHFTSIAFPAISTGIFKFPLDKASEVILSNIKDYLDSHPNSSLRFIYLASIKPSVISAFQEQMKSIFPQSTSVPKESGAISKTSKPGLLPKQHQVQKSPNDPEIILGFLNKIKCNVIVNTTNNSLDLSTGAISKAILADAGPKLQEECYKHSGISTYDVAVTSGYNLPCDNVFHISLPHWSASSVNIIKTYVKNCLLKADEMKLSHIAFPAFGTGNLGYPINMVANAMFSAISEYMSGQNTVIKKISIVIYPKDTNVQKEFENVKSNGPTISSIQTYQSRTNKDVEDFNTIPEVAAASNKTSQDGSISFDIKGVTLVLQTGSIIDQQVDGIVHGTNSQFTLNGVISRSLLNSIGHQFTKDCKSKIAEMSANKYAITNANSLPANYIVHVDIEGIKQNATQIFKRCFDAAEKHQITSLALPPLGTGGLGCSIQYFLKSIRDAVHDFAKSSPKNLKTVKIVIFQQEMFSVFCQEMASTEKSSQSFFSKISAPFTNYFSKGSAKEERFISKVKVPSTVSLFFYADNMDTIKEAKKKIDSEYKSKYFNSKNIEDESIKELPSDQKLIIDRLQDEYDVKIEFMPSKIIVSGYKDDVFTVKDKISEILICFVRAQSTKNNAEITQKFVQWSYMTMENNKSKLVPYSADLNHKLEQAYENDKILKLKINSKMIVFDLTNTNEMCEYAENDKTSSLKIVRKGKITGISIPDYWSSMENQDYIKIQLTSGDEYDRVKNAFPTNFPIVTIERIQNKSLYIQYQAQLEKMNSINPSGTNNEIQGLWHGTSHDVTEKINKNGFNRSYCGKNATAYGAGVYFAVNAQYSLSDTYSPPDSNGHKHIYMCNVLTGIFCRGDSSMRVPPDNPQLQGVPFNSTVDDVNSPKFYVSFHDANVYPAYLITCK